MQVLEVKTPQQTYPILFESSFDKLAASIMQTGNQYSRIGIITDDNVGAVYLEEIGAALSPLKKNIHFYSFTPGEKSKNFETLNGIYDFLIESKFDRKSLLIALGGGVVGDMTGFAAATYMRGVDFVQVPTTVLAQVDSSIGGKTGMDYKGYKNIIGAFYQPQLVYINTATLKTLPEREFNAGMAEVVKHGLIRSADYLTFLENNVDAIKSLDHKAITKMIMQSCDIKAAVVSADEKEAGLRAILNFGHTIGHAVERLKELTLIHGECVAIGMVAALDMSVAKGTLSGDEAERGKRAIALYGLPMSVADLKNDEIFNELFHDKKTQHNKLNFVLLDGIGSCYISKDVERSIIDIGIEGINENGVGQ